MRLPPHSCGETRGSLRLNKNVVGGEYTDSHVIYGMCKLNVRKWRRCVEKPSSAREARVRVGEASVRLTFLVPVVVSVRRYSRTDGKALVI